MHLIVVIGEANISDDVAPELAKEGSSYVDTEPTVCSVENIGPPPLKIESKPIESKRVFPLVDSSEGKTPRKSKYTFFGEKEVKGLEEIWYVMKKKSTNNINSMAFSKYITVFVILLELLIYNSMYFVFRNVVDGVSMTLHIHSSARGHKLNRPTDAPNL